MKKISILICSLLLVSCAVEPVKPLDVVPSPAQLAWHEMEMNAFVHFSINTFTDKEWGYGDESPALFAPDELDPDQWVKVFRDAGFKGVILTAKHHDGFCLWPSQFTEHSIKNSPVKTDVVKAVSEACKKYGLKFGIYLSPWDRNHPEYGRPPYVDYYRAQLDELFKTYGPVFEMWFDGANGGDGFYGGAREKRTINGSTYYQWPATLDLVRSFNSDIIFFSDAGPGVRWVGNERGVAGETNWNTITADTLFAGKPGIEQLLNTGSEDGTKWIPAETDVSIRPGWFYHASQDALVKSPDHLFEIYLTSVGRGSTLLLNVPPDRHGKINPIDVESLQGFRKLIDKTFALDHAPSGKVEGESRGGPYQAAGLTDTDPQTIWATEEGVISGSVTLTWENSKRVNYVVLEEPIKLGQRVRSFDVEAMVNGSWSRVATGTTIGYKRILKIDSIQTNSIRINIYDSKECVVLSGLKVY